MPRKISKTESGSGKERSPRASVGSHPVLNPAIRSKVGSAKLAKAVRQVWAEKKSSAVADASHRSETRNIKREIRT